MQENNKNNSPKFPRTRVKNNPWDQKSCQWKTKKKKAEQESK